MNLKTVKNASELKLVGVKIELTRENTTIRSIQFTDADGNLVDVTATYGITVSVQAPPEMKKAWKVSEEIVTGVKVEEIFDSEFEANQRQVEIASHMLGSADGLKVEEVEIPVEG